LTHLSHWDAPIMTTLYDTIGLSYAELRPPDARIAARIHAALGSARTVLNVGAGAGSYEPTDRIVTALEPSSAMIVQRPASAAKVVQGVDENFPFPDGAFDAVMGVLTVHHWTDKAKGMREIRRASRGPIVILTFDPAFCDFWLLDYFPELAAIDEGLMPPLDAYAEWLRPVSVTPVLVPHDCTDGFGAALLAPTSGLSGRPNPGRDVIILEDRRRNAWYRTAAPRSREWPLEA
jgi:SAM-dependent methyltransferase